MENNRFPEQGPQGSFPEQIPDMPAVPETPEVPPVMAELDFASDSQPIPLEDIPETQALPVQEAPSLPEDAPTQEHTSIIERIRDMDEDLPVAEDCLSLPETPAQILPDEEALDLQGLLNHGMEEPPFDMSILDDPDLLPPEEPVPVEDIHDQEYRDNSKDFDAMFQAAAKKEQKKPDVQRPAHKGRPKRKSGEGLFGIPSILVTVVWLALILVIGMTLGRMLWVCAADVLAFGREDKPVTITIYEADTMDDIVDKLHENGLIRYKSLFNLYASISDAEEDIQPGIYDLNTRYDYHALVNFMSPRSSREVIKLTIPEGYTCRQIFALLEENRICTAVDLGAYAADGELSEYWFLEGIERGSENALEGFLFPDTYEFYKNSTPKEALEKMLDNFNYRFTEEMRAQIETLNANVTGGGYTVREITIIASLIEKESAAPAESGQIAGVIYNRLFNWEFPALLNIDAAIVYAQGGEAETIDTSLDSPYNTYTHVGLTPTPIANPGLSSLQAALNPATHEYYYYVLNPSTGMHQFSTTQGEHEAWIAEFYS